MLKGKEKKPTAALQRRLDQLDQLSVSSEMSMSQSNSSASSVSHSNATSRAGSAGLHRRDDGPPTPGVVTSSAFGGGRVPSSRVVDQWQLGSFGDRDGGNAGGGNAKPFKEARRNNFFPRPESAGSGNYGK